MAYVESADVCVMGRDAGPAAALPATVVPIMTVMMMMMVVPVAWIGVIGVVAWIDIGITIVRHLVGIIFLEIIIRDFAIIVSVAPPVRFFDDRAGVCRKLRVAGDAGDRRSGGGHCPEDQRHATHCCSEPMLHFHVVLLGCWRPLCANPSRATYLNNAAAMYRTMRR